MLRRGTDWLAWLIGAAALGAVIGAALHLAELEEFVRLLAGAEPWWFGAALFFQACTYAAEGSIWGRLARRAGLQLAPAAAFRLSLAKLFVDQSVPTAGLSGTLTVAHALSRLGAGRRQLTAGVVVRIVAYYIAYVLALCLALAVLAARAQLHWPLLALAAGFSGFACVLVFVALRSAGRRAGRSVARFARIPVLREVLPMLADADRGLLRDGRLIAACSACQLAIVALDAATLYVLVLALGGDVPAVTVFASFMISSLFRSLGVLPGGLGSFEAASVVTLEASGLPLPLALAATLMFRVLSFWLPMLPGLWLSRRALSHRREDSPAVTLARWWASDAAEILAAVRGAATGLTTAEAAKRLARHGRNELGAHRAVSRWRAFANQFRNPLLGVLVFAAAVSLLTGAWVDATIVLAIVLATVGIGYLREYDAEMAAEALRARVRTRVDAMRDGVVVRVDAAEVVPGDVVVLAAGSLVPGDGVLLDATDCFVSEAVLTGESFPVAKEPGVSAPDAPLAARRNCLFLGTNVRSGFARMLVLGTGMQTEFGRIAHRLAQRPPPTSFDRGLLRFGYLLTITMLLVVLLVFLAHVVEGRAPIETLLFAVALAVGLSPELLPAVLRVNLARGARMMARHGVLVRRLNAIENLGSMDVLCTDKTGTLTEGVVRLEGAWDPRGEPSPAVLELAAINAALESGLHNPLDDAIEAACRPGLAGRRKLGEIPFDFVRKRVGVVVSDGVAARVIVKGAFRQVLAACTALEDGTPLDAALRERLEAQQLRWSEEGTRLLAVATRSLPLRPAYSRDDEHDLRFAGFLGFVDRPKPGVETTLAALRALGIAVKVITGDARAVSLHVARALGLEAPRVLTGADLDALHDEALWREAERTDLFVEVDPNQKERIILALRRMGHVVGFLGDGVNDAPAMHAADTSLSVEEAVDVAREAADFVLLERSLEAIRQGVLEGRRTFANTLKYVLTTTSANLGNMMSMALASLYLPFLPLLAGQILLNNFLSDVPAVGLADDNVDEEMLAAPRRWDLGFIARYIFRFGGLSSLFDVLTFVTLLGLFAAPPEVFRTGWFIESLLTELLVALVVRTRRPCWRSRPGRVLLVSTFCLVPLALVLPWLPCADLAGFVPLPPALLASLVGITLLYVLAAEIMKPSFYRRVGDRS